MIKKLIKRLLKIFNYQLLNLENQEINLFSKEDVSIINLYAQYSMTSDLRRSALLKSFNHIKDNKINGDFVECGVWKGGNIMSLCHLNTTHKTNKKIYGYDTFCGMSRPTIDDVKEKDGTIALINSKDLKIMMNFQTGTSVLKKKLLKTLLNII